MDEKKRESILEELDKLIKVMAILRGPVGCPWDKKQDYYSIKENIIEEAYEVVEALERNDIEAFKEELGDLLLQVVFESQMAYEKGDFDLADVAKVLREKLIRRHPHVFSEVDVDDSKEVLRNWERIKQKEKQDKNQFNSILDRLNQGQSALNQAYDVQKIAAQVGFDWDDLKPVLSKIEEEFEECREIIKFNSDNDRLDNKKLKIDSQGKLEGEIGDLLFAVVNLARFKGINPEIALLKTILKFKSRFEFIEKRVADKKKGFEDYTLKQLDAIWDEAKKEEKI